MEVLKKIGITLVFATASPVYLLYMIALIFLAFAGFLITEVFGLPLNMNRQCETVDDDHHKAVKTALHPHPDYLIRITSTLFFAVFSPLYMIYIVIVMVVSPIMLVGSEVGSFVAHKIKIIYQNLGNNNPKHVIE